MILVPSSSLAGRSDEFLLDVINRVICCFFSQVLQAMPSVIIVAFHFPPKIAIMTPTRAVVPLPIKADGGTTAAIIQTLMVYT